MESWQLWKVRKTILQMLKDRGFGIIESEMDYSIVEFKEKFKVDLGDDEDSPAETTPDVLIDREKLSFEVRHNETHDPLLVSFARNETIRISCIKELYRSLQQSDVKHVIMIMRKSPYKTTSPITTQAKRAILSMSTTGYTVELFLERELIVNISRHKLVPPHIVLGENEKRQLLRKYKLKEMQLPRIKKDDPIARYFGVKPRQIMKIIRDSKSSGKYVTYRIVV